MSLLNNIPEFLKLPEPHRHTAWLRMFTLLKVPSLFFMRPSVVQLDDEVCTVKMPFKRRNKNHINSMFVGVLTSAADCTSVLAAMHKTMMRDINVVFALKDMHVDFKKRAEGDTYFTCTQGLEIAKYVEEAVQTKERLNRKIKVIATCPDKTGDEPVAEFTITLSLKAR